MHTKRLFSFILILFFMGGCRPQPVDPKFQPTPKVSTVFWMNISGLSPWIFKKLNQAGALPNISLLPQEGASGAIHGGVPVSFAGTLVSMSTGKNPTDHGVEYWYYKNADSGSLVAFSSEDVKVKTLPQMLAMRDQKSLSVFWPLTYPAKGQDVIAPGPVQKRSRIGDYAFFPDLGLDLEGRCGSRSECGRVDEILGDALDTQDEIIKRFCPNPREDDPIWKAVVADLVTAYRVDRAAMSLVENLWTKEHRLVRVNLVGAALLERRLHCFFDPENFSIEPDRYRTFGTILVNYYKFIDQFAGRAIAQAGADGAVIISSDHGIGRAKPLDANRGKYPGRAHPVGWFAAKGGCIEPGTKVDYLLPPQLTLMALYLLDQPIAKDMPPHTIDRLVSARCFEKQPVQMISTYEKGKSGNDAPKTLLTAQDRYLKFNELAPPEAN